MHASNKYKLIRLMMAGAVGLVLYVRSQLVNDRYIKPRKYNILLPP